jgi:transposase
VRLARERVTTIRGSNRAIAELDRELEQRTTELTPALLELPGCAAVTAAKLLAEIGPIDRFLAAANSRTVLNPSSRARRLRRRYSAR